MRSYSMPMPCNSMRTGIDSSGCFRHMLNGMHWLIVCLIFVSRSLGSHLVLCGWLLIRLIITTERIIVMFAKIVAGSILRSVLRSFCLKCWQFRTRCSPLLQHHEWLNEVIPGLLSRHMKTRPQSPPNKHQTITQFGFWCTKTAYIHCRGSSNRSPSYHWATLFMWALTNPTAQHSLNNVPSSTAELPGTGTLCERGAAIFGQYWDITRPEQSTFHCCSRRNG